MMPSRRALLRMDFGTPFGVADHWIRLHRTAMACRFTIQLPGEDAHRVPAVQDDLDEVERIEAALTVFREGSDLVRLNRRAAAAPVAASPELFALLALCRDLHAETGGAFDITSTPLSRCWGFLAREGRLPASEEIEAARALVGMEAVTLDAGGRTVRFQRPGLELNLGSIGKGYALGRIGERLRGRGLRHALLSAAGSSVLALGGRDGGWLIDVRSPQKPDGCLARLRLRNGALGTSGAGEQFVEVGGTRYGHVIDPRTGWPAKGVLSASVVHCDAAVADALATAFFVGGPELARRYCATHPDTLALVTPSAGPARTEVIGAYPGATLLEAAAS
jgi:FAD:protein FMN transferase